LSASIWQPRGNDVAVLVVAESGRALGRLVAAVANLTMARKIILTGEGVRLAVVAHDAVAEGIRLDRDPRADPLDLDIQRTGFDEWARGAAATAIQTYVLDSRSPDGQAAGRYRRIAPGSAASGRVVQAARKRSRANSSSADAHASRPIVSS
jgi:hypothetical protein